MASSGYLVTPKRDPSKEELWTETWQRIDRFLPDLRTELALEEPAVDEGQQKAEAAPTVDTQADIAPGPAERTEGL